MNAFVTLCALAVCSAAPADGAKATDNPYVHVGLTKAIEFRECQDGVAGTTSSVWFINRDGLWGSCYDVPLDKNSVRRVHRASGKLSKQQLLELARVLNEESLYELPEVIGPAPDLNRIVNPHDYRLQIGSKTVKRYGASPSEGDYAKIGKYILDSAPKLDPQAELTEEVDQVTRFSKIVAAIMTAINESKKFDDIQVLQEIPR